MSSEVHLSSAGTGRLTCPKCQRPAMRRVSRQGLLQNKIFPLFGLYPWECGYCRMVKIFKNRGKRRSRRTQPEASAD